ncbi:MAG TPA: lysine-sensitive aspartokinase 3 [Terriglobales bacterium]|nr:lysine-sensitive aspartokinase 3 [Terriglobales bacterium]
MIVMKFGGTSVEDASAIERVTGIVRSRSAEAPVVVVSALAKVTDQLLAAGQTAATGDRDAALESCQALRQRHRRTACELFPGTHFSQLQSALESQFDLLRELLARIAALQDLTPRSIDCLLSFGELLSSEIVTAALIASGLPAECVDARECIITDCAHTRAAPLFEETRARLEARLRPLIGRELIPVMGGFIGSTLDGIPTTIGRGGSDYSASIVGAAMQAERIEIWTDVPGLMTTDPGLCPEAYLIEQISFEEAAELASFGAKVLHPATLLPAIEKNIPVCVLNSRDPAGKGTWIRSHIAGNGYPVRAIAAKRNTTIVNVAGERAWIPRGFLREVLAVCDRHDCQVDIVASSQVSISLAVESGSATPELVADLERFAQVSCEPRQAIVSVVGENLRGRKGIAARVFGSVAAAGVNVRMISQGASEINIAFVIQEEDVPVAVRRLHTDLFAETNDEWQWLESATVVHQRPTECTRLRPGANENGDI